MCFFKRKFKNHIRKFKNLIRKFKNLIRKFIGAFLRIILILNMRCIQKNKKTTCTHICVR